MITLVAVLKSVDKANFFCKVVFEMCKCKKFVLSIASKKYLLILKRFVIFLLSFRQCYPTICE